MGQVAAVLFLNCALFVCIVASRLKLEVLWIEACMMLLLPLLAQSVQISRVIIDCSYKECGN